ncbi:MAG: NADH:flavin oxidoreductase/NADH oxidase [bacterium]|jgi:2,4-dienoyl-CoA reductase-like NADH-dependent reductase (Old Yellow Enzyme family)
MSLLFSPLRLRALELPNRIQVSPMCQYSAVDGSMNDWHLMHYGSLALSGAGLLVIEATHVSAQGRITHGCSGLYSDDNAAALARVLGFCRAHSTMPIGIQLGHAGRKASSERPWEGRGSLKAGADPWPVVAASDLPFAQDWPVPAVLDRDALSAIREAFVRATERAAALGLDLIELHSAHGYLLSTFLSPLSNHRTDEYGGSRENRMRFPLEIFAAMRAVWPAERPMGVRIHGSDWTDGGWGVDDAVAYAAALQALGCDYVTVSSGGVASAAQIPVGPGYQVDLAEAVRRATGIVTCAVGMITGAAQAEAILAQGRADQVALARAMLFNPHWPWAAAAALGASNAMPPQYARAAAATWRGTIPTGAA